MVVLPNFWEVFQDLSFRSPCFSPFQLCFSVTLSFRPGLSLLSKLTFLCCVNLPLRVWLFWIWVDIFWFQRWALIWKLTRTKSINTVSSTASTIHRAAPWQYYLKKSSIASKAQWWVFTFQLLNMCLMNSLATKTKQETRCDRFRQNNYRSIWMWAWN